MNLINVDRVSEKTTLSRATIYAYARDGKFPSSIKIGVRQVGWVEAEVDDWVKGRVQLSRAARQEVAAV
jgi:prophage regulatory protein